MATSSIRNDTWQLYDTNSATREKAYWFKLEFVMCNL